MEKLQLKADSKSKLQLKYRVDRSLTYADRYERSKFYILTHPLLEPHMRTTLLRWIADVCNCRGYSRECFHKCVDYIDRFLTNSTDLHHTQLQLVGIVCLMIAVKVEEGYRCSVADFADLACHTYTCQEILEMEAKILFEKLSFNLLPVTAYAHTAHNPCINRRLVLSLIDACLCDIHCLHFSYQMLALSASLIVGAQPGKQHMTFGVCRLYVERDQDLRACLSWMSNFWPCVKSQPPQSDNEIQERITVDLPFISKYTNEYQTTLGRWKTSIWIGADEEDEYYNQHCIF